ncbi:MAG: nitrate reductase subunit beta [Magnetococcus sp. MYC-9]
MNIRAQIAMVLNLDKCIGCHTCSVTCKNVWSNRRGVEYAWFNNVESKPGIGYPKNWEDQSLWRGGWQSKNGALLLRTGGRLAHLKNIFANPDLPQIDDYYEPFDFDYAHLQNAPLSEATPTARPRSLIDGLRMEKIQWGPNWEDGLAGEFAKRSEDVNFAGVGREIYAEFEKSFQLFLPRLCNHCLNPACVAGCPSGSIYKRVEDGIVLVDQERCRGWRMCVSACPYKKVYYNWESGKSEKCLLCYPRIESGMPTNCAESCVGRIRYMGVVLYDADRIRQAAVTPDEKGLYQSQLDLFLNPHDPEVVQAAQREGVPASWLEAARRSPVYKMAVEWKIAFPLHPEFRTLPMMWYVPPLSPIQSRLEAGQLPTEGGGFFPEPGALRLPVGYLANLFTAGEEKPVLDALHRLLAMRTYRRSLKRLEEADTAVLAELGLTVAQVEEMYRLLALADYRDRYVIPTSAREWSLDDPSAFQGHNGLSFGHEGAADAFSLFPDPRRTTQPAKGDREGG